MGGSRGSLGLSGTADGMNFGGGDWLWDRPSCPPRGNAAADRTFRIVDFLAGGLPDSRRLSPG